MNEKEIQTLQKDLPTNERVRRFELLPEQLTVENVEITPTLKVKRRRNVDGLLWKGLSQKLKRHSEPASPKRKLGAGRRGKLREPVPLFGIPYSGTRLTVH